MYNKKHGNDRNSRRSADQRNYFPRQDSYHPRNENSQDQGFERSSQNYGSGLQNQYRGSQLKDQHQQGLGIDQSSQYGYGYGSNQNYSDNPYSNSTLGSDDQTQRWNEYPNFSNSNRSDYRNRQSFDQGSSQSWSQPVRNDEASQTSRSFYGKGPKGFKRSDERIREEVCEALYRDHAIDASEIDVTVRDGEVVLSGTVESRQMKRHAEYCVDSISGVSDIKNEIKVQAQGTATSSSNKVM